MAGIARRKKVTDPLDDKVRARIFCCDFSSGSEHSAAQTNYVDEYDSPCLSNLLCGFLDQHEEHPSENGSEDECDNIDHQTNDADLEILNQLALNVNENSDEFKNVLVGQVSKAIQVFWFVKSKESLLKRNVMAFLRSGGYNAGICKTKWESSGGLTAGNYEFIDVLKSDDPKSDRYFIDLNFANEFVIARQTNEYERLVHTLPKLFIGNCDHLKPIVKVMCDGARRSLRNKGLHLPPWRKNRFMKNKWFGPYRRTVNLIPTNVSSAVKQTVKCRSVGFNVVNSRSLVTRTR